MRVVRLVAIAAGLTLAAAVLVMLLVVMWIATS